MHNHAPPGYICPFCLVASGTENAHVITLLDDVFYRDADIAAFAFKQIYRCGGVSSWQHNEPAGYQDVWHYHLHVFPRCEGDALYQCEREALPPQERKAYAEKLRRYFENKSQI